MGLLDGLLGSALGGMFGGGGSAQQNPLVQTALQLLQQNGGLQGIVDKFQQAGYGEQADSWVSTGQNQPIDADALQQALGQGQLGRIAQQLGMAHGDVAGGLASLLPQLIDTHDAAGTGAGRSPRPGRAGAGDAATRTDRMT